MKARAVIGVPFGQHPLGYMVVRNPVRNISQPEPLQLACFVAMMMVLQKRRIDAERRYISDITPEEGKLKMRYNILGQHSMDINGQRIREQDLAHPNRRGWVILLYLILHKALVDQLSMAAELWPDESEKSARANIRQAIYRLHSDLAVYHDAKVIDVKSGMLELLDDVHIVTDAKEMESLPGLRLSRQAFTIFRFKYQDCLLRMFPRTALKTERYFCCSEVRQAIQ